MKDKIWKNKKGVFELPMQYMVAVVIAGVVVAGISIAGYDLWKNHQIKMAVKEVKKIVQEAEEMYVTGESGTIVTLNINLPHSIEKVVFGSSNKNLANQYYILMDWGENQSFFSKVAKFRGGEDEKAILYAGMKEIVLKLEKIEGEKYVKIYT